jgi:hypothetical protein
MDTFLGLIGLVAWIVGVITLAAAVTWAVVKALPGGDKPSATEAGSQGGTT